MKGDTKCRKLGGLWYLRSLKVIGNSSILWSTDEKDIYIGYTENPKESPAVLKCSNLEERYCDKTPVRTINLQTVSDGICRRVINGRQNTSLILVDHRVKVIEGCYLNVMQL